MSKPYVIGLDLGGTNSVFGIVDKDANIVESVSVKTGKDAPESYLARCVEALKPLIEKVGGVEKIQGMGIGAPMATYTVEWWSGLPTYLGKAMFPSPSCSARRSACLSL